jgi:hypothetical protein
MTFVVLTSASGAPGVSTAALGLAMAWPRPVLLIEADPSGGSTVLAGWFHGRPPHNRGLVNLAMAMTYAGGSDVREWLPGAIEDVVVTLPGTEARVISGIRAPGQAGALEQLWGPLASTAHLMSAGGVDVLVDAGRLGMRHAPTPLLEAADAVLLTSRATLPAIATARGWSRQLLESFGAVGRVGHLGLLLVGAGHTYGAREVKDLLGLPLVAGLPWDPRTARAIHLGQSSRRLTRGPLARALRAAVSPIVELSARNQQRLTTPSLLRQPVGPPPALTDPVGGTR